MNNDRLKIKKKLSIHITKFFIRICNLGVNKTKKFFSIINALNRVHLIYI